MSIATKPEKRPTPPDKPGVYFFLDANVPDLRRRPLTDLHTRARSPSLRNSLKVKFAKCVTIGVTVGGIAHNVVSTNLEPVLVELTPGEYKKWVAPGVKYACKLFGVSIAWWLQMTISAFHSASRGAQLFARGTLAYAVRHKYLSPTAVDEKGKVFNFFIVGLGCLGFWWQFWNGFSLPFPVNVLLLPVTFAEYGMRFLVFMLG